MDNTNLSQNVDTLFTNLENFTQNQGVIGKPVTHENKTFMPVVSVTLGYGSGNTATKAQPMPAVAVASGKMAGGALGLGAKLSTDAILVIDKDNVSILPVNNANTSQLIDKIPQMISGMGQGQQQGQGQGQQQSQGQQQGNKNASQGNQNKQS